MVDSTESMPFFLLKNAGFGRISEKDELLHPESFADVTSDSATETQYFGFNIPEQNIHALMYLWWHPNLKVCSGGAMVFQGVKSIPLSAELFDWRIYLNDREIVSDDIHRFRLDNGYCVEVVDPLRKLHATYEDDANQNAFDVTFTAVQPAVMFADGKHFEQPMRCTGDLTLRGKSYKIDCYNVRDRSWGKGRPESVMSIAPITWLTGVFNDDFSFNCNMFDHESGQPERAGKFVVPDDEALNSGWVYRDGKLGRLVKATKRMSRRHGGSTTVSGIELELTDHLDRKFNMRGSLVAACPMQPWLNMWIVISLIRWDCDGFVGYGDCQDTVWGPYLNSDYVRGLGG